MSSLNNKIECLRRLVMTENHYPLIEWLYDAKLAKQDMFANKSYQAIAEIIFLTLSESVKNDAIMLLDYEWTILPREFIRITVITEKEKQEFTYNI